MERQLTLIEELQKAVPAEVMNTLPIEEQGLYLNFLLLQVLKEKDINLNNASRKGGERKKECS